ncbi:P63C domain-containing protein [Bradyrhizobium sp. USDA 4502]
MKKLSATKHRFPTTPRTRREIPGDNQHTKGDANLHLLTRSGQIAPGVQAELKQVNPKHESGRRKHKYFQWLTTNVGYPMLREHIGSVVTSRSSAPTGTISVPRSTSSILTTVSRHSFQ